MGKKIQLNIPTPCHEDWDAMDNTAKGKFCGSCQKHVIDFTNMSDRQLAAFFKKPSTGNVCGRLMGDQLDRPIEISKKRVPWLKYFFTIAIPAFFASKAAAQQQHKKGGKTSTVAARPVSKTNTTVLPEIVIIAKQLPTEPRSLCNSGLENITVQEALAGKVGGPVVSTYSANENSLEKRVTGPRQDPLKKIITGIITDEKGERVPSATVLLKGTKTGVVADINGEFRLLAKPGNVLVISGAVINTIEITIGNTCSLHVFATSKILTGSTVVTVGGMHASAIKRNKKREIKAETPVLNIKSQKPTLQIFPNPAMTNSSITIKLLENTEEGYYTCIITASSGQNVYEQQLWIDKTAKVLSLDIPSIPAGTYNLSLINKISGKSFAEKIVVQ